MIHAYLKKLPNNDPNKFKVFVHDANFKRSKTIKFGDSNYQDYTIHKDPLRKKLYDSRHKKNENWSDPYTAGFWAKQLLWNKPTLQESIKDIENRFNITIFVL